MHDALILENCGLPAGLLCTSDFVNTARVMSEQLGQKEYPIIEIDHPIGRLDDKELTLRVRQAIHQCRNLLFRT